MQIKSKYFSQVIYILSNMILRRFRDFMYILTSKTIKR